MQQGGGRYRKGDSIRLANSDCTSLTAYVKDITLSKTSAMSDEQLRKMGPAGEAFIKRTAVLLISGDCKPAISDAPAQGPKHRPLSLLLKYLYRPRGPSRPQRPIA